GTSAVVTRERNTKVTRDHGDRQKKLKSQKSLAKVLTKTRAVRNLCKVGTEAGERDMTAQKQYEQAERLAREADRNGGPLPVALLQEAAAAKYPPAVYALANWHLHGKGVKRDYKKAVELLKMAAAKKHPAAEYDLAV